jgi:hypothetical protein
VIIEHRVYRQFLPVTLICGVDFLIQVSVDIVAKDKGRSPDASASRAESVPTARIRRASLRVLPLSPPGSFFTVNTRLLLGRITAANGPFHLDMPRFVKSA